MRVPAATCEPGAGDCSRATPLPSGVSSSWLSSAASIAARTLLPMKFGTSMPPCSTSRTTVPVLGVPELDGLPLAGASGLPSADAVARLLADDADPGVTAEGAAVGGNDSLWRSTTVSAGPLAAFGLASAGGADGLLASESVGLASARSSALPR